MTQPERVRPVAYGRTGMAWIASRCLAWAHPARVARNVAVQRAIPTSSLVDVPTRAGRLRAAIDSVLDRPAHRTGRIWGIAMVRNEQDIIVETVRHLLAQGVDRILVADNGSTDCTPQLLADLALEAPVSVVPDTMEAYWQAEKVSLLARAAARHGAEWIVPFDADEMWAASDPDKTLAEVLHAAPGDIVEADWFNYVPLEAGEGGDSVRERFPYRERDPDPAGKIAFRSNWLARVGQGNHNVYLPRVERSAGLRVNHFRYRSLDQMVQKARDGVRASQRAGLKGVSYWREVAEGGPEQARAILVQLREQADLVYDPVR